jgi:hypothetical protein
LVSFGHFQLPISGFTAPTVSAEYLDDSRQVVDLLDFNETEISRTVDLLNQQSTAEINCFRKKLTATQKPTIQGYSFSFIKGESSQISLIFLFHINPRGLSDQLIGCFICDKNGKVKQKARSEASRQNI